jgi:hypothetical protein
MEVHAHAHTERKKFTHYLWEFLMLFLAVTLGFFVENWREHIVERGREKDYIRSLVEDVQLDIPNLQTNLSVRIELIKQIDTLFDIYKNGAFETRRNDVYFLVRRSIRRSDLYYNDRTIQQLKNSGGLRLIHDIKISNLIADYDRNVQQLLRQQDEEDEIRVKIREYSVIVFDPVVLNEMIKVAGDSSKIARPNGNPSLKHPEMMDEILGHLQYLKNISMATQRMQRRIIEKGKSLIDALKKYYHLRE